MQDIDFDELDRAVSSVISPNTSDTLRGDAIPVAPRPTAPSPAARRSSGRFMDVVHPSSDMRPHTASDTPAQPAPAEPVEASPTPSDSFQWPDPIELTETHSDELLDEASPVPDDSLVQPLDSPFLPDAKVEKRPLGSPMVSTTLIDEATEAPKEESQAEPEEAPMPVELHEDIVKLEETEMPIEELEAAPEAAPEFTPATPVVEAPAGPTSITQQYKEQPSTTNHSSGPIYDTEAYHQPLSHPEKKHSSILVIIWILALILVGGGMGAAAYFFVLPML